MFFPKNRAASLRKIFVFHKTIVGNILGGNETGSANVIVLPEQKRMVHTFSFYDLCPRKKNSNQYQEILQHRFRGLIFKCFEFYKIL
jgi:hypothetical protein